jgi:hypothetical protein
MDANALDAAKKSVDQERLLPAEDPDTSLVEDAEHWVRVYDELVSGKREILRVVREKVGNVSADARREINQTDSVILEEELERFERRLSFWRARHRELSTVEPTSSVS